MKYFFVLIAMIAACTVQAQSKPLLQEDSIVLFKIIPGEIPQPIVDTLQQKNFQLGDVYTAHRNGNSTMYVVEISHELVRETFWFDPKGHQLRQSAKKVN
jgi:hypothetical protein